MWQWEEGGAEGMIVGQLPYARLPVRACFLLCLRQPSQNIYPKTFYQVQKIRMFSQLRTVVEW
jgi:hypothetical protein